MYRTVLLQTTRVVGRWNSVEVGFLMGQSSRKVSEWIGFYVSTFVVFLNIEKR